MTGAAYRQPFGYALDYAEKNGFQNIKYIHNKPPSVKCLSFLNYMHPCIIIQHRGGEFNHKKKKSEQKFCPDNFMR